MSWQLFFFDDFKSYVFIKVEKYPPFISASIFSNYAVARYRELAIRKNWSQVDSQPQGKYQKYLLSVHLMTQTYFVMNLH